MPGIEPPRAPSRAPPDPPKLSQDLPKVRQRLFWAWLGPGSKLEGFWGDRELSSHAYSDNICVFGTHPAVSGDLRRSPRKWSQEPLVGGPLPTRHGQDDGSLTNSLKLRMGYKKPWLRVLTRPSGEMMALITTLPTIVLAKPLAWLLITERGLLLHAKTKFLTIPKYSWPFPQALPGIIRNSLE